MLTRPIPSTGEEIPVIGLGTWRAFDVGADEATRRPLREVLRRFLDAGGRLIDSSPMYGRAEGVTGDLMAELPRHPRAFLATKVWTTGRERGADQMRRSAQLLRADVIDLMQIHNLVDWRTHLASLRRMKEEGHIRYICITHYTTGALPELAHILGREPGIDSSSSAIRWQRAQPRANCYRWPRLKARRSLPTSRSNAAICFAGCVGGRSLAGQPNSTAPAGRSCSSNTSSPSPRSPA